MRERFHASARDDHLACAPFPLPPSSSAPLPPPTSSGRCRTRSASSRRRRRSHCTRRRIEAVRGKADSPLPANIVWRTERRLNDPDCTDKSSPGALPRDRKRKGYERSRLGWAAQTLDIGLLRAQLAAVPLPERLRAAVFLGHREGRLRPARRAHGRRDAVGRAARRGGGGRVHLPGLPRAGAGKGESAKQPCKKYVRRSSACRIRRDAKVSGGDRQGHAARRARAHRDRGRGGRAGGRDGRLVHVGREQSGPPGHVQRRRARWSTTRAWRTTATSSRRAPSRDPAKANTFGLASTDSAVRRQEPAAPAHGGRGQGPPVSVRPRSEFQAAFDKGGAQWLSADCHRSQYGYPFRVGIADDAGEPPSRGDAGERRLLGRRRDRACSWITMRASAPARRAARKVPPQLDQLADLICRGGAQGPHAGCELHAAGLQVRQHRHLGADHLQAMVPAGQPQAPDRSGAALDRRQRHRLRRARALRVDRERARPRADRGPGRRRDPLRAGGVARLSRRARQAHQGGARRAGRRLRRRARARAAERLRADPVSTRPAAIAARSRRSAWTCIPRSR